MDPGYYDILFYFVLFCFFSVLVLISESPDLKGKPILVWQLRKKLATFLAGRSSHHCLSSTQACPAQMDAHKYCVGWITGRNRIPTDFLMWGLPSKVCPRFVPKGTSLWLKYSQFLLLEVIIFYNIAINIELANTKSLLLVETQGLVPVSPRSYFINHSIHNLYLHVFPFKDILFNIYCSFNNIELTVFSATTQAWRKLI